MEFSELKSTRSEELHAELARLRRHLFDLRSQAVTEKLGNPTQLGKTKRDIARVLTALQQRGEADLEQKQHHLEAELGKAVK